MATSRVGPHRISLASSESNKSTTREPAATPLCSRTPGPLGASMPHHLQPASVAVRGLDGDRQAILARKGVDFGHVLYGFTRSRHHRHAHARGQLVRAQLVAQQAMAPITAWAKATFSDKKP